MQIANTWYDSILSNLTSIPNIGNTISINLPGLQGILDTRKSANTDGYIVYTNGTLLNAPCTSVTWYIMTSPLEISSDQYSSTISVISNNNMTIIGDVSGLSAYVPTVISPAPSPEIPLAPEPQSPKSPELPPLAVPAPQEAPESEVPSPEVPGPASTSPEVPSPLITPSPMAPQSTPRAPESAAPIGLAPVMTPEPPEEHNETEPAPIEFNQTTTPSPTFISSPILSPILSPTLSPTLTPSPIPTPTHPQVILIPDTVTVSPNPETGGLIAALVIVCVLGVAAFIMGIWLGYTGRVAFGGGATTTNT